MKVVSFHLALVTVFVLGLCTPVVLPQEDGFHGWDTIRDDHFTFDPDTSEVATFAIQVSAEVRYRLYMAGELMRVGNFRGAVEPLQEVINLFPTHLFQVSEYPPRWVGAAEYARYLLASFPPEGREEYAKWAELRVGPRYREAAEKSDLQQLEVIANRWALTPHGLEALRILGDLANERGDHELASRYYRRRLLLEELPSDGTAEIALRAAVALTYQGDVESGRDLLAPFMDSDVAVAGNSVRVTDALLAFESFRGATSMEWPVFGGSPDHTSTVPVTGPGLHFEKEWSVPAFSTSSNPYSTRRSMVQDAEFPFHPVVADETIVITDGLSVRGFSFFSREPKWTFESPLFGSRQRDGYHSFEDYTRGGLPPLGSLARSLPLMATVKDRVVVAPLFDRQPVGPRIRFDRTEIITPIPIRSLHGIDLETGRQLWHQRRPELDSNAFVNRVTVNTPPIVVGDRVIASGYVLEGAINSYVLCLSLHDGSLVWKTPIVVGQQELTMFNKSFKEFSLQMPAERDGSIFVCTNLGLFACLDTVTGDLRWVSQYESIPIRGARHYSRPQERTITSNNDAPVVAEGVVIFSPRDSYHTYAVEASTGKRLWSKRYDFRSGTDQYRFLLGIEDGVVVLGGVNGVGFHDLHTGRQLGRAPYPRSQSDHSFVRGRGCLGQGVVYQPLYDQLMVVRWSRDGAGMVVTEDELIRWKDTNLAGNVLLYRDFQITIGLDQMTVFFDVDALAAVAMKRVEAGDPSIEDLILLGNLENLRGRFLVAIEVYERALAHESIDADAIRRIHDGLFKSHGRLAESSRSAGDQNAMLRHLTAEARYASTATDFLETVEAILDVHDGARNFDAYLATLDWIDESYPEADFPFASYEFGGSVRAGLFTLERRATVYMSRGEPERAVEAWQGMIREYREVPFEGQTGGRYASDKIARAIESYGPQIYRQFEDEAAELRATAIRTRDHSALASLIDWFPNSTHAVQHRLDLARLLLDRGDHGGVFGVVAPLLNQGADVDRAHALYMVARGAELAGDRVLAGTVWSRLQRMGGDMAVLGGEGESYASLASREINRLGTLGEQPTKTVMLEALPELKAKEYAVSFDLDTHLVSIEGAAFPGDRDVVMIYELAQESDDEAAYLRLIDVSRPAELWSAAVDDYYQLSDPITAYVIGGRLVVRQQRTVRGFDPNDGSLLFESTLPTVPSMEQPGPGLFFLQWSMPDGGSSVAAMELASGSLFWQRSFPYEIYDLVTGGDRLLVLGPDGDLEVLDSLTGATSYDLSLLNISRGTEVAVFEEFSLLIAAGLGSGQRKATLLAFDLTDGRRLWEMADLPSRMSVGWVRATADSLVLLKGSGTFQARNPKGIHTISVLAPRSGRERAVYGELPQLATFERGPSIVGQHAVLLESSRSRRARTNKIAVIDLAGSDRKEVALDGLPRERSEFVVFATRDGGLVGKIDVKPTVLRLNLTYVFTLDPLSGQVELQQVPSEHDRYWSYATITPRTLVVLKDDRLCIYPTGAGSR